MENRKKLIANMYVGGADFADCYRVIYGWFGDELITTAEARRLIQFIQELYR